MTKTYDICHRRQAQSRATCQTDAGSLRAELGLPEFVPRPLRGAQRNAHQQRARKRWHPASAKSAQNQERTLCLSPQTRFTADSNLRGCQAQFLRRFSLVPCHSIAIDGGNFSRKKVTNFSLWSLSRNFTLAYFELISALPAIPARQDLRREPDSGPIKHTLFIQ